MSYDAIVIGSGFGGAAVACRLAESGRRVLVLERGRRWRREDYPVSDNLFWEDKGDRVVPGWFDLRGFGRMSTVAGAGVGGGSLHYANVSIPAPADAFDAGWPPEITHQEMRGYYEKVTEMLTPGESQRYRNAVPWVHKVPPTQDSPRTRLLSQAATAGGFGAQFGKVSLAINFDENYAYDANDEPDEGHARYQQNPWGVEQGFCVHLGYCVLGCPVKARNMLEYNYIARAEQKGAEVRPLHLVRRIEVDGAQYRVRFDRIDGASLSPGSETAGIAVVAAGSVGSTELLLRCRDEHRTLPNLSPMLGRKWCSNTNYLTVARHKGQALHPKRGPSITAAVGFFGPSKHKGQAVNIEDGGGPDMVRIFLRRLAGSAPTADFLRSVLMGYSGDPLVKDHMPWFSQGRDDSVGVFHLKDSSGKKELALDWDPKGAAKTVEAIIDLHESFARSTGGKPPWPFVWRLFHRLITPHPLGGCGMGRSAADGVVDHQGRVFGYSNLYVADGAIIPRAIGLNPSKTIAALGERVAAHISSVI